MSLREEVGQALKAGIEKAGEVRFESDLAQIMPAMIERETALVSGVLDALSIIVTEIERLTDALPK